MSELPRVLVIAANPFARRHSNSLTLSSLFEGWDPSCLAQIYVPFVTPVAPAFDVCRRFWAMTPLGLRPVSGSTGDEALRGSNSGKPVASRTVRRTLVRLAAESRTARRVASPLRELAYSRPGVIGAKGVAQIEAFAPQIIFTTLGSLHLSRVVIALSDRFRIPVMPFFTDDWITTEYTNVLFGSVLRRALCRSFDDILARSPIRLAISDVMVEEYSRRYGGEFHQFTRCLDASTFHATPIPEQGGEWIELVYAGQLTLKRWAYLRRIGEALERLGQEGIRARLTIYTVPAHVDLYRKELTRDPVLRIAGHVESHALPAIYAAADVLVHCESFDPDYARYTRYSLSTKISEYLMAGRPILGYGPSDIGSMQHVARSGAGVVIGENSVDAVVAGLRDLLSDRRRLADMGRQARAVGLERHEATHQRLRFRDLLVRAARVDQPPGDAAA